MSDAVAIVGAGRAGRGLARALRASGVAVSALIARRTADGDPDGAVAGSAADAAERAGVVLIAVQDTALPTAIAAVAEGAGPATVVLQLSGSAADAGLAPVRARGAAAGTFHPLVPLVEPARAVQALRGGWVGLGGDPAAVRAGERLAGAVGARTLALPDGERDRALYHAAAVVASNFPVALAALAEALFARAGVGGEAARDATRQLMRGALDNLDAHPPRAALTGPVVRGDAATVLRHLGALSDDGPAFDLYVAATTVLRALAGSTLEPAAAAALDRAIAGSADAAVP